ncbi:SPT3 Dosage dependent suppressor of Ty-induced promoter mutations-like protein [Coemansia sp. BCRC 34301]|nr:SPT3 Dosage dependent suppressor of Ty-induced promoter mutations-like protein [Coemansia sp. BCRC 34301]
MASSPSANGGGTSTSGPPHNINDYLRASAAGENSSGSVGYGGYQAPPMQLLPADISAFLMSAGAVTRSTPGSPATFNGGLGFHSVRTSPVLGPSMPQSPGNNGMLHSGSFTNLAALGSAHPMFSGFDSTVHSAVQSANASPIVGAFNRRGLLNSMANLNMAQLPPTAMSYMDTSAMFGSPTTPFSNPGPVPSISVSNSGDSGYPRVLAHQASDMLQAPPPPPLVHREVMQMSPPATAEFIQQVEEIKARGLVLEMEGIPKENAKSRVETQIRITLRLKTEDTGEPVSCWTHLALPEDMVSREKFIHRLQKHSAANTGEVASLPVSPHHVLHLEGSVFCSGDPTRKVEACLGCIRREYKRGLRRKDAARLRSGAPSTCTTPGQSRPGSPTMGESMLNGVRMTGSMEVDWDEQRIAKEKERILIFNCNDILDFSKGGVTLPTRITCYCRHHNEKDGFCICLTLRDSQGNILATHISPPILITDDHKSTKFKTDRRTTRTKPDYERQGDGSVAYANHALAGMGMASPLGNHPSHLHLIDGSVAGFKGGRQAMSARNSPTLRPYAHHAVLDTYSQFASLAGTPSLGNTPLGSPLLSAAAAAAVAAQMGGFDTSFNLPQAASSFSGAGGSSGAGYSSTTQASSSLLGAMATSPSHSAAAAAAAAAAIAASNYSQQQQQLHSGVGHYSIPNSATGLGPSSSAHIGPMSASSLQMGAAGFAGYAPNPQLGALPLSAAAVSSGSVLFGNIDGFSQHGDVEAPNQQQSRQQSRAMVQIGQLFPTQGPVAGGISVLISGRGFHSNIAVYFGGVQAGRVQVLSPSNIACVLPPTKSAGPAPLRIHDLTNMTVFDGAGEGQTMAVFTYIEDTDHTMLELSLLATGLRPPQQQQQQQSAEALSGMGSPRTSPVIGGSPADGSSAKMLQDVTVFNTLRQLRTASESRNLVEIESGLVSLFATLLDKGMLDMSRLSMRHETTGRTLLHFAALLGMLNLMSFLASHGVSLDETDHNGMSAMHFASMYGRLDIVEMLLRAGASYGVRSAMGNTPAELARMLGHGQIQMLIEDRDGYMSFIRDDQQLAADSLNQYQT